MPDKLGRFQKGEHWRNPQKHWNKNWLYQQYVVLGKSSKEIAQEQNCSDTNILYFLHKYAIKRRSVAEARRLKYWGSNGVDNPMFNRRGDLNPHWQGGITPERQAFYTSEAWKKACRFVWKRDKAICQRCRIRKNEGVPFHIHHIVPFRNKELRADVQNLILLCKVCHNFVHSKKNVKLEFISSGGEGVGVGN